MDGFRVVKMKEVVRQVDMVITCTGDCRLVGSREVERHTNDGFVSTQRQQKCGGEEASGQDEERLHSLQHGPLQHRNRFGKDFCFGTSVSV